MLLDVTDQNRGEALLSNSSESAKGGGFRKMNLLFVYGTLKKGFGNHRVLYDGSAPPTLLSSNAYTYDTKWDIIPNGPRGGGFPYLIPGDYSVMGELYLVNDKVFRQCDGLEGYPNFYDRHLIPVSLRENPRVQDIQMAWAYVPADAESLRKRVDEQNEFWGTGVYMSNQRTKVWVDHP